MTASSTTVLAPHDRPRVIITLDDAELWGMLTAFQRDANGRRRGHVVYRVEQTYRAAYEAGGFLPATTAQHDDTFIGTRSHWLDADRVRRPSDDELGTVGAELDARRKLTLRGTST